MYRVNRTLAVLSLSGLTALLGMAFVMPVTAQDATAPAPKMGKMGKEKHPELVKAMKALTVAKTALQKAARDFDGHRTKAVEHVDAAMAEVKLAMESDKK